MSDSYAEHMIVAASDRSHLHTAYGYCTEADRYALARCARRFLTAGAALAIADEIYWGWRGEFPNFLVTIALVLGLGGLALADLVERRADRALSDQVLTGSLTERWSTFAVLVAFFTLYAVSMFPPTPFNEQVRQAVAFIHGHTYIDAPNSFLEHAQVGAYSYALHPPLPAILLMPFTAIWGMDTNQTEFSVLVGAIDVVLAWILLGRLKVSLNPRVWLTFFFAMGNVLWYETVVGTTWALPMNTALIFQLASLIELFGEARPVRLGIFAGLASLGRYDLALAAPIYALLAWKKGRTFTELLGMIPGFLAVGVIFVGLNEARYGSFFDQGVMITGPKGAPVFAFQYLPGNLYTLFFMAPTVDGRFPYIHPVFAGQALTTTSPAFVLALRPSFRRLTISTMFVASVLVSIPSLLCYANGFAQFGTRHYIPAFPFLLVMMALGMRDRTDQLARILITASIIIIGCGVWQIRMWGLS
ncbi:MAG: hypothetical protein Q7S58_07155 [Candidatus Binatus sp.]|uniref:hypothetical protein n=1 Tax=Candidatus Binatus sp. TaxID=2811406 RepID=UPI0027274C9B|nr:hypothetical protein [Candidatus Binatus sp.]MDO8432174.1 hypothetical protein [Candidatus Binatus sp.]